MKITLNGAEREFETEMTIAALLEHLKIPRPGTAVAIGDAIVPQKEHDARLIRNGDRVEVLRAIGGG